MRIYLCSIGLAFIGSVTAGEAGAVELYVEYGEFTLDGKQDPAELLNTVREGTYGDASGTHILLFSDLPDEGGSVAQQRSVPTQYVMSGHDLTGAEHCNLGCNVNKTSEGKWVLEKIYFHIGEEVPYLVTQERHGEGQSVPERTYTQRSRSVGFIVSKSSVCMEPGTRKVIDARIEEDPDQTVCRYLAVRLEEAGSDN